MPGEQMDERVALDTADRNRGAATVARRGKVGRKRALTKIVAIVVLANQILTTAFAFVAQRNHPDAALGLTTLFSFALCTVLSVWIRSDAKYAYRAACDAGYVETLRSGVRVARRCPRRWLVVLYVELQGGAVVASCVRR
ncbi:hypothetical protein SAMN05445871_2792 [Paraburkholderia caballeronis]|uniref:Uncharacterized protein n=2 Tax=Paraburkholderia caballeronis TaxID=416943 RepID=A0A1H7VZP4_9BURK|nr:hypothetical protein C7403_113155 [Paraburkholderia caballeronis]PXW96863.1 hypothetical protein C7407_113155 [Paraburkholderia caballeronis]RAJ93490.1 hypothetical protein C7409_113155 [Paraburkholderia caballeronis]SEC74644.1 hypothetical protein SAMN05445871_2792 [Paraburkholderia caballeronis]SEM14713.1 hypothetical protein SAMN05192542_12912 [Paraburkholderia caballeronis]